MGCLFCKIVAGEIPSEILHKDDQVTAFKDVNPQAPHHVLIIPNRHLRSLNQAEPADQALLGHMMLTAAKIAKDLGVDERGYRILVNTEKEGGQVVWHLHMHLMAGRQMQWPPG